MCPVSSGQYRMKYLGVHGEGDLTPPLEGREAVGGCGKDRVRTSARSLILVQENT